ncbi:hypothetical protein N9S34_02605 [bacterium]|nr:hypothetical protein [bacterium]
MILKTILGIALFINGGHILSTNLKLHHYSDDDYKDIFYLKNNKSITKHCERHLELEDIKKKKSYHNQEQNTVYKVTKHKNKASSGISLHSPCENARKIIKPHVGGIADL